LETKLKCSLSPLLFSIVPEVLVGAVKLEENKPKCLKFLIFNSGEREAGAIYLVALFW